MRSACQLSKPFENKSSIGTAGAPTFPALSELPVSNAAPVSRCPAPVKVKTIREGSLLAPTAISRAARKIGPCPDDLWLPRQAGAGPRSKKRARIAACRRNREPGLESDVSLVVKVAHTIV